MKTKVENQLKESVIALWKLSTGNRDVKVFLKDQHNLKIIKLNLKLLSPLQILVQDLILIQL